MDRQKSRADSKIWIGTRGVGSAGILTPNGAAVSRPKQQPLKKHPIRPIPWARGTIGANRSQSLKTGHFLHSAIPNPTEPAARKPPYQTKPPSAIENTFHGSTR